MRKWATVEEMLWRFLGVFVAGVVMCMLTVQVPATLTWRTLPYAELLLGFLYALSVMFAAVLSMGGLAYFLTRDKTATQELFPTGLLLCYLGWTWFALARSFGVVQVSPSILVAGLVTIGYAFSLLSGLFIAKKQWIPEERHIGWVLFAPLVMVVNVLLTPLFALLFVYLVSLTLK